MGGTTHRVLCTWQLLGLAAMVGIRWTNFYPGCINRLGKRYSHPHFGQGGLLGLRAGVCLPKMLTIACLLMSGHG